MSESAASDVANRSRDRSDMQSTGESAVSNAQMHLLRVGENKDFSYLRDLLSQSGNENLGWTMPTRPKKRWHDWVKPTMTC